VDKGQAMAGGDDGAGTRRGWPASLGVHRVTLDLGRVVDLTGTGVTFSGEEGSDGSFYSVAAGLSPDHETPLPHQAAGDRNTIVQGPLYLFAGSAADPAGSAGIDSATDLLRRIGVLLPDGRLTQAGALVFCSADRTYLSVTVLDVDGGDVVATPPDLRGSSLLEQLSATEDRLDPLNSEVVLRGSFAEIPVRRLPTAALREAILNGLVHRDWHLPDPVTVTWVQADVTDYGSLSCAARGHAITHVIHAAALTPNAAAEAADPRGHRTR